MIYEYDLVIPFEFDFNFVKVSAEVTPPVFPNYEPG